MRILKTVLFLSICVSLSQCAYVSPKEVTLRVHELGSDAGEIEIMSIPGRYSIAGWSASDYSFPITEQNYRWTEDEQGEYGSDRDEAIQLQIEGNDCKLDVGIRFYVMNTPEYHDKLKYLVTKYPTDLDGIVDGLLYDLVRGSVKGQFEGKQLDDVMDNLSSFIRGPITESVREGASEYGIRVVEVYDISGLAAPQSVMAAKQATQESAQKIRRAEEDAKEQAIRDGIRIASAKAVAEEIRLLNLNAPSDRVLEQMRIEKWNGVEAPGSDIVVMAKQ